MEALNLVLFLQHTPHLGVLGLWGIAYFNGYKRFYFSMMEIGLFYLIVKWIFAIHNTSYKCYTHEITKIQYLHVYNIVTVRGGRHSCNNKYGWNKRAIGWPIIPYMDFLILFQRWYLLHTYIIASTSLKIRN
jgi:hypothetical protein